MIGCSEYTREKWNRFEYFLEVHAKMCRLIMMEKEYADSAYSYFDFFAGPGLYDEREHSRLAGEYGSPIRAHRVLRGVFDRGERAANGEPLGVRSFLYDPHESLRLQRCLHGLGLYGGIVGDLPCDRAVAELISRWPELTGCSPWRPFGLAFFDPNGQAPWSSIRTFVSEKKFRCIDVLINVNSVVGKRLRRSSAHAESLTPTQHLVHLGKRKIYLWEPVLGDIHQFALAYCTNGPFPEFRRHGFHLIDSDKGRRIANRIDMTAKERERLAYPGFLCGMEDV